MCEESHWHKAYCILERVQTWLTMCHSSFVFLSDGCLSALCDLWQFSGCPALISTISELWQQPWDVKKIAMFSWQARDMCVLSYCMAHWCFFMAVWIIRIIMLKFWSYLEILWLINQWKSFIILHLSEPLQSSSLCRFPAVSSLKENKDNFGMSHLEIAKISKLDQKFDMIIIELSLSFAPLATALTMAVRPREEKKQPFSTTDLIC